MNDKDQPTTEAIAKTTQGGRLEADVPVPVDGQPLDPARHQVTATQFIGGLHVLAGLLEGFGRARKGRRTTIANYASIPDEAFEIVARGLEFAPAFAVSAQLSAAEVRDMLERSKAYAAIRSELEVVLQALDDTIAETRGGIGERCSRAVKIGDQLTLNAENQEAILHLRQMLEVFKVRRRKTPEDERTAVKTLKTAKRRAAGAVTFDVTATQTPMEPVTAQFKAGRDLEP